MNGPAAANNEMTRLIGIGFVALLGVVQAQPVSGPGNTVNAADYSRRIAPGSYITVFGENLASASDMARILPLPLDIQGTSIEVDDGAKIRKVPLWYVSPSQVSGQLFYDLPPAVRVRVRSPNGVTSWDTIALVERAPAAYVINEQGAGRAILLHPDGRLVSRKDPLLPGRWATAYFNSLGAVDPPVPAGLPAGDGSPGNPLSVVTGAVSVSIGGRLAGVGWSGLAPYYAGLYQVNVFTPYYNVIGDIPFGFEVDGVPNWQPVSVPVEPNGFYYVFGAGLFPNGQRKTAVPGPGSAIVFRHESPGIWGEDGLEEWTFNSHLGPVHAATSGLALTLKCHGRAVYDNNGIENGTHGGFYNNRHTGAPDEECPGLYEWYSMSNDLFAVFASYFKLNEVTEVDQIICYFDGNGIAELRFDPHNVYNRYRVNIYSNGPGDKPGVNGFTGDIFASDTAAGKFEISPTGVRRIFSDGESDEIYRLVYTLAEPLTLEPAEYWFSHDSAVPEDPEAMSGSGSAPIQRLADSRYRPIPSAAALAGR